MIYSITSYDGNAFGSDYRVDILRGTEPRLTAQSVQVLERIGAWPVITKLQRSKRTIALLIQITGTNVNHLRAQLFRWFDPEDEEAKTLVAVNHDSISMSIECICEELLQFGETAQPSAFIATLVIDGDIRWRATSDTSDNWTVSASGDTHAIINSGEDEAYPTFAISPTSSKSGGYAYKRWVLITWKGSNNANDYPIRIGPLDTSTIIGAGKMQADGDDLRLFVDGKEVDRHLVDINDSSTYIWFSVDWQQAPDLELNAAIADSGSVTNIELDDEVEMALLPEQGFVMIGSEVFHYDSRDLVNKYLSGITRSVWNSAAAAHAAGDTVYWMQHGIVLVYDNASATAPSIADTEPVFDTSTSDNGTWTYVNFGDKNYSSRPARWGRWGNITQSGNGGVYTRTQFELSTGTYSVAGAWLDTFHSAAYGWNLNVPIGITNSSWQDGLKQTELGTSDFVCHLMYWVRDDNWWTWHTTLTNPTVQDQYQAWSAGTIVGGHDPADAIGIGLYFYRSKVEVGTVVVYLNADEKPVQSIGTELGNYTIAATLTNQTTDEAITIDLDMAENNTLYVNTDESTVTYSSGSSNQFQAVDPDSSRDKFLTLAQGTNTLRFDDTNTGTVSITTTFARRYY